MEWKPSQPPTHCQPLTHSLTHWPTDRPTDRPTERQRRQSMAVTDWLWVSELFQLPHFTHSLTRSLSRTHHHSTVTVTLRHSLTHSHSLTVTRRRLKADEQNTENWKLSRLVTLLYSSILYVFTYFTSLLWAYSLSPITLLYYSYFSTSLNIQTQISYCTVTVSYQTESFSQTDSWLHSHSLTVQCSAVQWSEWVSEWVTSGLIGGWMDWMGRTDFWMYLQVGFSVFTQC